MGRAVIFLFLFAVIGSLIGCENTNTGYGAITVTVTNVDQTDE